jgi:integrase
MPNQKPNARRPDGTGTVVQRYGSYWGQWRVGRKPVMRKLGPVRSPHRTDGLTRSQAEKILREKMSKIITPPVRTRMTIRQVGEARIEAIKLAGRKRNTTDGYESDLRVHFEPHFGSKPIATLTDEDIGRYVLAKLDQGLARKTIRNQLNHLNGIFEFAIRKRWADHNPVKLVDRPHDAAKSAEIQFLTIPQLEELLRVGAELVDRSVHHPRSLERAVRIRELRAQGLEWKTIGIAIGVSPATAIYLSKCSADDIERDQLAIVDRVLWVTAAMTGLRQGELLALLWKHVDWVAATIRAHKNTSQEGTVKSEDSFRPVPMADRVARELELHHQSSPFKADDDLVFSHPITGEPLDRHGVTKRFQRALKKARLPEITFHDLRHTFGTTMAAAGVPIRTIQEWMGHADIKTTQIYTHYSPRQNEAQIVSAAFESSINSSINLPRTKPHETPQNPDEIRVPE